ncbi:MAG: ABC transporter ATP-binding protein, partial [Lentisphaerota bacterium]
MTDESDKPEKSSFSFGKLLLMWDLIRTHRFRFALVVAIGVGMAFAQFIYPFIIQHVVDDVLIAKGPLKLVFLYFGVYILVSLGVAAVSYFRANLMLRISKNVLCDLRVRAVDRVIRYPIKYYDTEDVGKITSKVCQDIDSVDHMLTHFVWNSLVGFIQFIIGMFICSRYSWKLTVATLVFLPVSILIVELLYKRMRKLADAERKAIAQFSSRLTSTLGGIRVVKSFGQEARESESLSKDAFQIAQNGIRNWSFVNLFRGLDDFIIQFGITVALGVAVWIVMQGHMTIGQFMGYNALVYMLINPFYMILSAWSMVPNGVAAFDRVNGLLKEPVEMADPASKRVPSEIRGEVACGLFDFSDNGSYRREPLSHRFGAGPGGLHEAVSGCLPRDSQLLQAG